jgi:DNA-binding IclR family transcriptional regulator
LEVTADACYVPGLRLLELASRAWARNSFRQVAEPHLHQLHAMTGETVHLGVLRGMEIVYLDKVEGRQAVRMYSQIGNASPVYCTGIGKAALSTLDEMALEGVLAGIEFRRFTAGTHGDAEALRQDLEQIRVRGYAFDLEEHQPGIRCVAAAITSDEMGFAGGISITAPAFRVSLDQLQAWTQPVMDAARAMTDDLVRRLGPRKTK